MASPETFVVVRDTLSASWSATPVHYENDGSSTPEPPAHFIFVEVVGDLLGQQSIGAGSRDENLWRETGTLYLHVMAPNGEGSLTARQHGRDVANLFRGRDIDTVTFGNASLGAGEPGDDDGNYWRFTVTIDWQRDQ